MDLKRQESIIKDFPEFFYGLTPDGRKTMRSPLTQNGIECGDGWERIVRRIAQKLEPLGFKAIQVKEKMGLIRVYIALQSPSKNKESKDKAWDTARLVLTEAESDSLKTCETCGGESSGEIRKKNGWVLMVRCDPCYKEEGGEDGESHDVC